MRRLALLCFAIFALVLGGVILYGRADAEGNDTTVLGDLISKALSTPGSQVQVGAVDGALSSDATIRNIQISDRDGVWLRLDQARLIWSRLALLSGRLEVDRLEIGALEVLRRPAPSGEAAPASDGPLIPELPVKVEIKAFALKSLVLGEPVLGQAARIEAKGAAKLGDPSEGLNFDFEAKRLDKSGDFRIRTQFVPRGEKLSVGVSFKEPQGGLVSTLSGLPGDPPVDLDISGDGTLDVFNAKIRFDGGETARADGIVIMRRHSDGRRLSIDLNTKLAGLMPAFLHPIFPNGANTGGTLVFQNDGGLGFDYLRVQSDVARFEILGTIDKDKVADVTVSARALQSTSSAAPDASIGKFDFQTTVKGPVTAPRIATTLDLRDLKSPQARLGSATARFDLTPDASPAGQPAKARSFDLTGEAKLAALSLTDPAFASAIGDAVDLDVAAAIDPEGSAKVRTFSLKGKSVEAGFAGTVAARAIAGRLDLALPELSRFSGLAGLALKGAAKGGFDVSGDPSKRIDVKAALTAQPLATGIAPLDRLIGGKLTIDGGIIKLPAGGFGFDKLAAKGAFLDATVDGQATPEQVAVTLAGAISDLRQFDGRMTGKATFDGKATGPLADPDVDFSFAIPEASAVRRPLRNLRLSVAAKNLVTALKASANLSGDVAGKPATGVVSAARQGQGWKIDGLDFAVGSVKATGALTTSPAGIEGAIKLAARDLDDISALALTPLSGDLDATLTLGVKNGQTVAAILRSQRLRADEFLIERLAADVTAGDVMRKPAVAGSVSVNRALKGPQELASNLKLDAKPDGAMSVSGRAQGFDLSGAGRLLQTGDGARLDVARFEARKGGKRVALAKPGAVTLANGAVTLANMSLLLDGGRLDLDGRVSPTLDLTANARAVPLSIADLARPGLGLSGVIDASARVTGSAASPNGDWKVAIRNLSAPQLRGSGLPALQLDASGRLGDGRTTLDATLQGPRLGPLRATGSAPVDGDGALDLRIAGRLDLALANAQLGADGRRLGGFAEIDARVTGSTARPQIQGGANLVGASFADADTGMKLTNLRGRIAGGVDEVRLEGVSGTTGNGGTIAVTGRIGLGEGMPASIKITGANAQLMNSAVATATADVNLDISGPLATRPVIAGRVGFTRVDVTIPERLPGGSRPLDKVRHIAPPPQVAKRLAAQAKAKKAAQKSKFDAQLNLNISAPNRVFVRGRGVDAELGGELAIKGSSSNPSVVGGFNLRRGGMAIGGRRLQFTRAKLIFSGTLEPELDFLAQQQASDAIVYVSLSGAAASPDFKFYSEPDYPQDEVLARLLFGKSSGGLTTAQMLQVALIAAQFAGGGDGAFEQMRKQLGVDSLSVGLGADGGVGVGVGKAINDRISVGAKAGATPGDTGVSVDVDLSRRLRLQGEATADGNTGVGIGFEMEY